MARPALRRRRWVGALVLVVLVAGLAGCVGDQSPPTPASTEEDQTTATQPDGARAIVSPANATVRGCVGYSAQVPLPWEPVAEALPPGFEPAPFLPVPVGPVTSTEGRAAEGFFDGWRCQLARVDGTPVGGATFLLPKVEVRPPSDLAPPGNRSSFVPLFLATDAPEIAEAFSRWGLAAEAGETTVEGLGSGPVRAGHVGASVGPTAFEARVTLAEAPPTTFPVSGEESRYYVTDTPLLEGETEVTGVLERSTTNTTAVVGEGHVDLEGRAEDTLGPAHAGLGFDTQDGDWGESFRYRPVDAVR